MKKCEFVDLYASPTGAEQSLPKKEETQLPSFSTDLPSGIRVQESGDLVIYHYQWDSIYVNSPFLRVRSMVLRSGEKLEQIIRLRVRDGVDTIVVQAGETVYLLRKTTLDVAQALVRVGDAIREHIEEVIGYLQTLTGSVYSIAKTVRGGWTFDPYLLQGSDAFHGLDLACLSDHQKQRLFDLVQEKLLALHRKNLIFRSFTLYNLLLTSSDLRFTDLRDLRTVRKRSLLVEDFCNVLRYLTLTGVARRADVYQATITYAVAMEDACHGWYREKKGEKCRDSLTIVAELEKTLYE